MAKAIKLYEGIIKLGDGGDPETFSAIGGLTEGTIEISGGTVDVSSASSNGWEEYDPSAGKMSASISLSGVYFSDNAHIDTVLDAKFSGTTLNLQFIQTRETDTVTYAGNFVIETASDPIVATEGVANYSISLKSNGAVTRTVA